ncbi:hypothetical protein LPJ73_000246 [Coemansia sp. RSA 2703]|nr:hypothetical protein LPJ73_000246 [Coemansia sp. RSA 2703]KAJ2376471.1 hypothetical protein IW150_001961 [Coemansia sp. RSA 2607]KAJ2397674.1 hypothetical protein GGI05_000520 [Coemansia sp. RSA 2603]
MLDIYVESVYTPNQTRDAKAGMGVYFGPEDHRNFSGKLDGQEQNSARAEIEAIRRALIILGGKSQSEGSDESRRPIAYMRTTSWHAVEVMTSRESASADPDSDIISDAKQRLVFCPYLVKFEHVSDHSPSEGIKAAKILAKSATRLDSDK